MSQQVVFGRRANAAATSLPHPAADSLKLTFQAEVFGAKLAVENGGDPDFEDWLRARQAGRVFAWTATFILLSPGILCFVFKAPASISSGVELLGMVANFWLRRSRRRHLKEIASWEL